MCLLNNSVSGMNNRVSSVVTLEFIFNERSSQCKRTRNREIPHSYISRRAPILINKAAGFNSAFPEDYGMDPTPTLIRTSPEKILRDLKFEIGNQSSSE